MRSPNLTDQELEKAADLFREGLQTHNQRPFVEWMQKLARQGKLDSFQAAWKKYTVAHGINMFETLHNPFAPVPRRRLETGNRVRVSD